MYKFEVRVEYPDTYYPFDKVSSYVTTIEVESTFDAMAELVNFKLVVVPYGQS